MVNEGWVMHEMKKLIKHSVKIIQSELHKFKIIYIIIMGNDNAQEANVEQVFNSYVDEGIKVMEASSH
jgi:hypothetical protein